MAKNKKLKNKTSTLFLILVIVLLSLAFIYTVNQLNLLGVKNVDPTASVVREYHSELLDIIFIIPNEYSLKEENVLRELTIEKKGELIKFKKYTTNRVYKDIEEHFEDIYLAENHVLVTSKEHVDINGTDCVESQWKNSNNPELTYKNYLCFLESTSFLNISTNSPNLYSDLDQIARSIRYIP